MEDKSDKTLTTSSELAPIDPSIQLKKEELANESLEIINQAISEQDLEKVKDLTELFNLNQKKKTMVRINKANDLLDLMTDQSIDRFTKRPDEISNQELLQGIKIIQDLVERSQKQINSVSEAPLIQINQQTNEVNLDGMSSKESRDKVKNAVAKILANIGKNIDIEPESSIESVSIGEEIINSQTEPTVITVPANAIEDEEDDD